ncbi:flagellar hook-basal body complex protein FliE [Alteromonas sediminis]|uniref:Flagellar hook-basal body complex protein FliE n=1 Tax=Alteromonas sediminis TaxID=2259342 RepID=A0A3N5Y4G0_9ALTE|nr:flagellar hook-basal body complex protein FliE [Alteromonas sediminis]RPJ64999.1 flagellar hook-basal body complex protein FliE [Alteromonas sediminis]
MEIKADSLYQEMQAMIAQVNQPGAGNDIPNMTQMVNPSQQNFADMLNNAINNVNDLQRTSRTMQQRFDMGDPNLSLADVMVAKEKSGIAFEATMQVRNKVLEAYKQIMNMPV